EEATARLYGPVFASGRAIHVYIGTAARGGRSAFARWHGSQSKWNCAYTLENSTEAGAGIMGVLCAAQDCPREKELVIYMSSQYIIRSFCYWAGDNETRGWTCANGEKLSDAVGWLAQRLAPVRFRWVAANVHPGN
ncbi:hypothetical protein GGX14DRAFT_300523, partial [Mycena pura]